MASEKDPVNQAMLKEIVARLKKDDPTLMYHAFTDQTARAELKKKAKHFFPLLLTSDEKLEYVMQEIVGLGFLEDILKDESVTDVGYNGTKLIIQTNDRKSVYKKRDISEDEVIRLISRFAKAMGREFTPKDPILDAQLDYMRINAEHKDHAPYGTTMAIRISHPKMVLTKENFDTFADPFMFDFFWAAVRSECNIILSGKVGTGKTEFQKLLISMIPFVQRIAMIEGEPESHVKELFPGKDIMSWLSGGNVTVSDLIKAALRANVDWIMVSETRGPEAYEMMQAVLSGHSIITTLHSVDAFAIPKRFINMAKMGFQIDEKSYLSDIYTYFHFGCSLKRTQINGHTVRYLAQVVEYNADGTATELYRRWEEDGAFHSEIVHQPSEAFFSRCREAHIDFKGIGVVPEAESEAV